MYEAVRKELYETERLSALSDDELRQKIDRIFVRQNGAKYLTVEDRVAAVNQIFSQLRGLGILDGLLRDDTISEIMINRFDRIFVEQNGMVRRSELRFERERDLEDIIERIVRNSGKEINQANPIVDTRLPGGERVNVVLPPISIGSPVVTIRRFPKERITMERLISLGSISEEAARFLRQMVCARYNIFISGGTSSGKTTFLNALSDFIPPEERIITIEDSAELQITGIPNLIRMEARNSNTTGAGAITIQNLIRTSLRMRPDRIIVGEVRGAEALDMLNAMNTGHDGSLSTGHANSSRDMLRRLETMVMQGSSGLPLPAVRRNVASSIDILVHLGKIGSRKRAVLEICEIAGMQGEEIALNLLFQRREGRLLPTGSELRNREKLDLYGERHEPSF
ncbi:MAG: CpaF family protein [Clostridia bacterium]|nr:CpaF family protein [Clostridia bacterium]